jgi:hypothetical protein
MVAFTLKVGTKIGEEVEGRTRFENALQSEISEMDEAVETGDRSRHTQDEGDVGPVKCSIAGFGLAGGLGCVEDVFEVIENLIGEPPKERDALEEDEFGCWSAAQDGGEHESEADE